jgi:hypothetical protein
VIIHRSLKVQDELWRKMQEKARNRGFHSTNAYLRHVIQEDLAAGTLEETEERLVSTISKLSAQLQSLSTMHQASFATLWAMLEVIVDAFPTGQPSQLSEQRLRALRVRIAADVRGNSFTEFQNAAST